MRYPLFFIITTVAFLGSTCNRNINIAFPKTENETSTTTSTTTGTTNTEPNIQQTENTNATPSAFEPNSESPTTNTPSTENTKTAKPSDIEDVRFAGSVIAGSSSPLLDFRKEDFDAVLASHKIIFLYFYANWCPYCKVETKQGLEPFFRDLSASDVVGFRVNFKDNETDDPEKALASEYNIGSQHTKIILKNNTAVEHVTTTWKKEDYEKALERARRK